MEKYKIEISVKGLRPLLQNAFTSGQEGKKLLKRGQIYDDQLEAESRLIKNKDGIICQPASHFEASMIKSAVEHKFIGRKSYKDLFKAGVFVHPELIPHKTQKYVIDKQAVVISKARILRCRPRFDNWELDFTIIIRDERIDPRKVEQVLECAGKYHGIGDYRPRYGLFELTRFDIGEN